MDESCEVQPEEDKVLPETKKRRLKTPYQLKALENFYNEHKYPSESLKAEVALELGLTEKQVSGWFCHRRLKDKRLSKDEAYANGRQDLSSGVIQDRGSGLKQDSCSSNKQGHYRYSDLREVESRRFDDTDYPAPDLAYENRSKSVTIGNYRGMENNSSGSSSTSQERLLSQSQNPYDMESLRYSSRSNNNKLMVPNGANNKGNMMASGYLHLQDEIANAAITAVKRQLGREFREDGPPLGTEFQPLPPDAFDSPIRDPINRKTEHYHPGDHILQTCQGISKVRKEPSVETGYPRFRRGTYPQGPYPESRNIKRTTGESVHRESTSYPNMRKSSLTNSYNGSPVGNSALDNMDGRSVGGESVFNGNVNHFMRSKYGSVKGVRSDSILDHRPPSSPGKAFTGESSHALYNYEEARPQMIQRREYLEAKPSHLVVQKIQSLDTIDGVAKDKNLQREKRIISKEFGNPPRVKKHLKNGTRVRKRLRGDQFMPQDYVLKTPYPEDLLPGRSQIKESFGDMRTSLSEDETAATDFSIE